MNKSNHLSASLSATLFAAVVTVRVVAAEPMVAIEGPVGITHPRPQWMKCGIVCAATNSPWYARLQKTPAVWTQLGYGLSDDEAAAGYKKELGPETADQINKWGVTMVFLSLYSGMTSFEQETTTWPGIKACAELMHARGIKVAVYIQQGNLSREFLEAMPEAYEWLAWQAPGTPYTTPPPPASQSEGYTVYRNHPGYQAFMRGIIDYAVKEVKADFLHFDNYVYGSGFNPRAVADFRAYLRAKYTSAQLKEHLGGEDLKDVEAPVYTGKAPLTQEWQLFQGWMLADSYRKLADYARSLNPEVATEVNPSGLSFHGYRRPIDLSLLAPQGDAFWDEQAALGWDEEKQILNTGIRSYKLARLFHQSLLSYTSYRLAMSESMAFNYNCMGTIYSFLYGRLNWAGAIDSPAHKEMLSEVRFFRENHDLFDNGETLADVAVWRGRDSNINDTEYMGAPLNVSLFEQAMIAEHIPFEIIFDQHLDNLKKYRAVVAADQRLVQDAHIDRLIQYVESGGSLVLTDQTACMDQWARPRPHALKRFFAGPIPSDHKTVEQRGKGKIVLAKIVRPADMEMGSLPLNGPQLADAVVQVMGEPMVHTDAPVFVGMETIRQSKRISVHLVDYSQEYNAKPIHIRISPTLGNVVKASLMGPRQETAELQVDYQASGARITVPKLDIYAVAVVNMDW